MNELTTDRRRRDRRKAIKSRAGELLDAVGMSRDAHQRPSQFSGGQRQRVNIARALMNRPAVLVVDEPTSALDRERGTEILDLTLNLTAEHDTATLLVPHEQWILLRLTIAHTS